MMALYKYFKKTSVLPNSNGFLSNRVPSSAILEANKKVKPLLKESGSSSKKPRGEYLVYTNQEKLMVGRRAAEMAVTSTLRFFARDFAACPLKESTVRTWATKYKKELALRSKLGKDMKVTELESALHYFWVKSWMCKCKSTSRIYDKVELLKF